MSFWFFFENSKIKIFTLSFLNFASNCPQIALKLPARLFVVNINQAPFQKTPQMSTESTQSVGLRAKIRKCDEVIEEIKKNMTTVYGTNTTLSSIPKGFTINWFAKSGKHVTVSMYTDEQHGIIKLECSKHVFAGSTSQVSEESIAIRLFHGVTYKVARNPGESFYTFRFRVSAIICTVHDVLLALLAF